MPPTTKQKPEPAKKPEPKPAPKAAETEEVEQSATYQDRPVVYPFVSCEICTGKNAITDQIAADLLGWESEREHLLRMQKENPGISKEALEVFKYGDAYMLKDTDGQKIRCWNNLDNRPFDDQWSLSLAQVLLSFQWAGQITMGEPTAFTYGGGKRLVRREDGTVEIADDAVDGADATADLITDGDLIELPAGTVNGSTIVVSRTGRIESGQHSLVGLRLAYQMWWKNRKGFPQWSEGGCNGPVIETILITGISEDRRVLMTVDNCKPRSELDVFYTSDLFRALAPKQRQECSRMLAAAVDFLWRRTARKGYKTHPEAVMFVDDHKRLLKSIGHLFTENQVGRKVSNLRISAGMAAGLCYLMGCAESDGEAYRNGAPPTEKGLNWKHWDKAKEFWALVGSHPSFGPVRTALGRLYDSSTEDPANQGQGGRLPEKLAVIMKAWDAFLSDGRQFTEMDLKPDGILALSYNNLDDKGVVLPDGRLKLLDLADFKGIDVPEVPKAATPPAPDEGELDARKEEQRRLNAQKLQDMQLGKGALPAAAKPASGPVASAPTAAKPIAKPQPKKPALKGGVG